MEQKDIIWKDFKELAEVYRRATIDLRIGHANNNGIQARQDYNNINFDELTQKLLNEYQDYIDSLGTIEDKQQAAGHFLFNCKKYFYGLGWKAAQSFTNYIIANSPLKDDDKIHYLQYLLEALNPQKEENKEKGKEGRNNLHPFNLTGLKKLAEFQFIDKEKKNIDDLFDRINSYLNKHKKYAPYIFAMLQSCARNLQTIKTEDFIRYSETYFKAMNKMLISKTKDKNIKIDLIVLNKIMAREGNSKEAIGAFVKIFADYLNNTGPTNSNTFLCERIGELVKNKTQNYSLEEQKQLQQVWLEACPLKRKAEANIAALSFLNQIGPEILLPENPKKAAQKQEESVSVAEKPVFDNTEIALASNTKVNETMESKLRAIANIEAPSSSEHYDVDDYSAAKVAVNLTIKEKMDDILYEIRGANNPKEKTLEVADAYNRLVNGSSKKNIEFDRGMVNLFDDVIKRYDYSPEDVYVLLQHINNERHERSQYVKALLKNEYKKDNPKQKITPPKSASNKILTPNNQLELDF